MSETGLHKGQDGIIRCWWSGDDPLYQAYHDQEWGRPQGDERALFEKLCLEGFQAGLSWITILKRREHFRRVFKNFEIETVAHFGEKDVARLLGDAGIIRHRGKIEAAIHNARCVLAMHEKGDTLAAYLWSFRPDLESRPARYDLASLKALTQTKETAALSKDLKKRGFKFVGATTLYAMMQAVGMVNDHVEGCHCRKDVDKMQKRFKPPAC